jgi:hypothetical protein
MDIRISQSVFFAFWSRVVNDLAPQLYNILPATSIQSLPSPCYLRRRLLEPIPQESCSIVVGPGFISKNYSQQVSSNRARVATKLVKKPLSDRSKVVREKL